MFLVLDDFKLQWLGSNLVRNLLPKSTPPKYQIIGDYSERRIDFIVENETQWKVLSEKHHIFLFVYVE